MVAVLDGGCPICAAQACNDGDYFARAFGDEVQRDAVIEALADSLGFCPRHGRFLAERDAYAESARQVLLGVVRRTLPLLAAGRLHDEQVQRVLFPALHACPACRFDGQRTARHAGRIARGLEPADPASLCLTHFRLMARELEPGLRLAETIAYLGILEPQIDALENDEEHRAPILPTAGTGADPGEPAGTPRRDTCPVCIEVAAAERRWLGAVRHAAHLGHEGWLSFPTCARHIREVMAMDEPIVTDAVVRHALENANEQLKSDAELLLAAISQEEATLRSWRRRRRKKSGEAAPRPARRADHCRGCQRIEVARDHAIGRLLGRLQAGRHWEAMREGYGLCMKHFASAFLIAPKGGIRALLAEVQSQRLLELEAGLAGDRMILGEPAWRAALRRFGGFGAPAGKSFCIQRQTEECE